jgi:peptidoglycan/LPS O-acetylase OafA/YrhL
MWAYGTEDAFTLVPNFLVTGLLAMILGAVIIAWSVGCIDSKYGRRVFLSLGALLFLVGGGVALVGFVALCWAVSRGIGRTAGGSPAGQQDGVRKFLARMWPAFLAAGLVLAALALEIAIAGFVPGVSNPDQLQLICWSSLAAMVVLLVLAVSGGSAHDAQRRNSGPEAAADGRR